MTILLLKSVNSAGMIDTDKNAVTIKGRTFNLEPNIVISAGDILSVKGEEFVVLPPDPSFFKDFAKRTAQIIQPWDAAVILFYCSITPGKKVLESGAGSGALSSAILSAVGENGSLTTVEMDANNVSVSRENVALSHKNPHWNIINSRIEHYTTDEKFDAIILDVPEPWNSVARLSRNLVSGGRICCYSPTYNQLEKNVAALRNSGYYVFENCEVMKRSMLVRENATRPDNDIIGHTAFLTFAVKLSGSRAKY